MTSLPATHKFHIPIENLVDRRLYILKSRNLAAGVWVADERGFVGIRTKWGNEFLDIEYFRVGEPFDTARAVVSTELDLPYGIDTYVYGDPVCKVCEHAVMWSGPPAPAPWIHVEDNLFPDVCSEIDIIPLSKQNKLLFEWLTKVQ